MPNFSVLDLRAGEAVEWEGVAQSGEGHAAVWRNAVSLPTPQCMQPRCRDLRPTVQADASS